MAVERIEYNELFAENLIEQIKLLEKTLDDAKKSYIDFAKSVQIESEKTGKAFKQNEKISKELYDNAIQLDKIEQSRIKTEKMLLDLESKKRVESEKTLKSQEKLNKQQQKEKEFNDSAADSLIRKQRALTDLQKQYTLASEAIRAKLLPQIQKLDKEVLKLEGDMGRHQRNVGNYKSAFNGLGTSLIGIGAGFGLATSGIDLFTNTVQNGIQITKEFEKNIDNLSAITGATGEELKKYSDAAIEMGLRTDGMSVSSREYVTAIKLVGSAKPELLQNGEALRFVTEQAILLSKASGDDLQSSVNNLTTSLAQFQLPADQAANVIDRLAAGSKAGSVEIPDITASLKEFGSVARGSNIDLNESIAIIELLGETAGIKGSEAGNGIKNVVIAMDTIKTATPATKKLLTDLGVNLEFVADKNNSLEDRFRELSKAGKDTDAMFKLFGKENIVVGQNILQNVDRFKQLNEAIKENGVASEQAKTNTDNFVGAMERLSNTWESTVLKMTSGGEDVNGILTEFVNILSDLLINFDKALEPFQIIFDGFNDIYQIAVDLVEILGVTNIEMTKGELIARALGIVFHSLFFPIEAVAFVLSRLAEQIKITGEYIGIFNKKAPEMVPVINEIITANRSLSNALKTTAKDLNYFNKALSEGLNNTTLKVEEQNKAFAENEKIKLDIIEANKTLQKQIEDYNTELTANETDRSEEALLAWRKTELEKIKLSKAFEETKNEAIGQINKSYYQKLAEIRKKDTEQLLNSEIPIYKIFDDKIAENSLKTWRDAEIEKINISKLSAQKKQEALFDLENQYFEKSKNLQKTTNNIEDPVLAAYQNQIDKFAKERDEKLKLDPKTDFKQEAPELKLFDYLKDPDYKANLRDNLTFVVDEWNNALTQIAEKQVETTEKAKEQSDAKLMILNEQLTNQIELQKLGAANTVTATQLEIEAEKKRNAEIDKERKKALKNKVRADRLQIISDSILQGSNLITASSHIYETTAKDPITTAIAIATIATMIGSFVAQKAIMLKNTKMPGFAKGGATGSKGFGNDGTGNVAGVVHTNEFVLNKQVYAKNKKLAELMHSGKINDSILYADNNTTDDKLNEVLTDTFNLHKKHYNKDTVYFNKGIKHIKRGNTTIISY